MKEKFILKTEIKVNNKYSKNLKVNLQLFRKNLNFE